MGIFLLFRLTRPRRGATCVTELVVVTLCHNALLGCGSHQEDALKACGNQTPMELKPATAGADSHWRARESVLAAIGISYRLTLTVSKYFDVTV